MTRMRLILGSERIRLLNITHLERLVQDPRTSTAIWTCREAFQTLRDHLAAAAVGVEVEVEMIDHTRLPQLNF